MNRIGRRIFFDVVNGEIIKDTGERSGRVTARTVEEDIAAYVVLSERNRDSFDYVELEYGDYREDFALSIACRINPETKELEFAYPSGEEEGPEEVVYQAPLSEKVSALETENADFFMSNAMHEARIASLEAENANLALSNAMQQGKLANMEQETASLFLELALLKGGIE